MRTYTITDVAADDDADGTKAKFVREGISITNGEGDPGLRVGDGNTSALIPVAKEGAKTFLDTKEAYKVHELTLMAADVADNGLRLIKERGNDPCVLVHFSMCAGVGGRLWLEATGIDEYEANGRIRRRPRMFPGLGVEVIAFGHGPTGEPQGLFRLAPGAAFRVKRNGALEGAPPVLDVTWTGRELDVCKPEERRERDQKRREWSRQHRWQR